MRRLFYASATAEPEKRARAPAVLDRLVLQARGKITTQVLGEVFPVVLTEDFAHGRRLEGVEHFDLTALT